MREATMQETLTDRIRPVTHRLRSRRFWWLIVALTLPVSLTGLGLYLYIDGNNSVGTRASVGLLIVSATLVLVAGMISRLSFRNTRFVAGLIEQRFPSLKQRLLTALSQQHTNKPLGYLQTRVIEEAHDHASLHRWADAVPSRQLMLSRMSGLASTALLAVTLGLLAFSKPSMLASGSATRITEIPKVSVDPGDIVVERGTSIAITARFEGMTSELIPDEGELVCVAEEGEARRLTMTQNLDDPVLGGFVASIDKSFDYQVVLPDWKSDTYSVDVFDYPNLVRSDANLKYPDYTELKEKKIEDTVRVSAVVGTEVTWICYLNKPVASAEFMSKDGTRIPLVADSGNPSIHTASFTLEETQRLTLHLVDEAGRANKVPPILIATALPNQPPTLKLTAARDVSVSPLEELILGMEVRDDFGIAQVGLSYTFGSNPETEVKLASSIPRGTKHKVEHMIEFESLDAEPDQLMVYHFWAEDHGPDGQVRRTQSDMFFAEVRPFEEIFREGQPPPGGEQQQQQQSQNGQQAEELAELQKEIINAAWTVIRSERGERRTPEFNDDTTLLSRSQADALDLLETLSEQIEDDRSIAIVDEIREQMQTAIAQFELAVEDSEVDGVSLGMRAAQSSYAGLLKLRAREFEVTRQRQQQQQSKSQSQSQQRRQQQIDELEIEQEENRYETQQQAEETPDEAQQRETRQILNRLRDLARRQEDLNKEVAQLQSAIEQAKTDEKRDEAERQLKRLREQQQEMLREVDELAEQIQQSQKQDAMSEAREKLEENREAMRNASEALQENKPSEALASGTRAQRGFEEMRDEFRQQASGQFNDAVRDMKSDAKQLDEQQKELAEQLANGDSQDAKAGLRGSEQRDKIEQKLESQREQLAELLDQMQETVEQAETAEPLLAQKLYDSFRKTQQKQVDEHLQNTSELLQMGLTPEAQKFEQQAGEAIEELREDIDDAANVVLGDQTRALQRALGELEQAEKALGEEIGDKLAQKDASPQEPSQQETKKGSPSESSPSGEANGRARRGSLMNQIAGQGRENAPLTGDGFREWSDRLRDVEEMVDAPELRSQAARIRDRARDMRAEYKRHSKEPHWELVEELIAEPLRELKRDVSEELLRRSADKHAPVPIDRDPVPNELVDAVRKYYESIGSGR